MRCLFLFLTLLNLNAFAQQRFVVLQRGDTVNVESALYSDAILREAGFKTDSGFFCSDEILAIKSNHGYFINAGKPKQESWAFRFERNTISLFERVDMKVYGQHELPEDADGKMFQNGIATGTRIDYYTTPDGLVRQPTYRNLKLDLADSPSAQSHLKRSRTYQFTQIGLRISGAALFTTGFIGLSDTQPFRFTPAMLLGVVMGGGSFMISEPIRDARWMAIDAYNKEFTSL
ncbi:MAG: hypothetical protein RL226_945 [Bacteroidota bacterium]|jgi:hypothetical protein